MHEAPARWWGARLRDRIPSVRAPRWLAPAVFTASLVPFAYVVYALYSDIIGTTRFLGSNPITEAEHFTGEWTLRFLIFTLAITPLRQLTRWGWLIRYRRTFGLFTFFYAMVHWSTYLGVDMVFDLHDILHDLAKHPYIMVGMGAFLLLVPLAATSTKSSIRSLGGKRWNRLHQLVWATVTLGLIHFAWGVKKDIEDPLLFGAIFGGLAAWRGWTWVSERRARTVASVPAAVERERGQRVGAPQLGTGD